MPERVAFDFEWHTSRRDRVAAGAFVHRRGYAFELHTSLSDCVRAKLAWRRSQAFEMRTDCRDRVEGRFAFRRSGEFEIRTDCRDRVVLKTLVRQALSMPPFGELTLFDREGQLVPLHGARLRRGDSVPLTLTAYSARIEAYPSIVFSAKQRQNDPDDRAVVHRDLRSGGIRILSVRDTVHPQLGPTKVMTAVVSLYDRAFVKLESDRRLFFDLEIATGWGERYTLASGSFVVFTDIYTGAL